MSRWSRAAIVGIVVYAAIDTALVFLRPELSVLHNAESDYGSKGAYAWLMDVNFLLRCFLSLAAVRAIALAAGAAGRLRIGLALLVVWSVSSGLLAFFADDPAGTPHHTAGRIHLALAGVAFVAVAVGTRITTHALRTAEEWRTVLAPLALLSWGAIVPVLLLGRSHLRPHSLGGLYEKVFLAMELTWFLLAAGWIAYRDRASASAPAALHAS